MKNFFVLVIGNRHYVLSVKKRTNPSSTCSFPVGNLVNFGNMSFPDFYVGILKETHLIFGKFNIQEDYTLINHFLLLSKYYIYSNFFCWVTTLFSLESGFFAKLKRVHSIELHIVGKRDKLTCHLQKWKKLISVVAK